MAEMDKWFGAMDWSGATVLQQTGRRTDLYGCALVAVPNPEKLSESLRKVRSVAGMAADQEFHAHNLPENIQLAVLREILPGGLQVAALQCDNQALHQEGGLPTPADMASTAALVLLERSLPMLNLASLVFDEDIQGKKRRDAFLTEVRRTARANFNAPRRRIRFVRSRSSDLAQVADIVVHNVIRGANQAIRLPELQECTRQLLNAEGNILIEMPG